jgi:hypothetical protein
MPSNEEFQWNVVAHDYNPSTQEEKQEDHEFEASLEYIASSRPAWAT